MGATLDPRFSDKFIKLYLNTPENRSINTLLRTTTKKIITDYAYLSDDELRWLEQYLSCIISIKKVMDIPKQLNIFIYKDQLPTIRQEFLTLRHSAPKQYLSTLSELQNAMEQGLNLIIRDEDSKESIKKQSGYHLSKYNRRS